MDNQTKITKTYIKNKKFIDLGFSLLVNGTMILGMSELLPNSAPVAISLGVFLTAGFMYLGTPLNAMARKVVNKYIAFKKVHLLSTYTNHEAENIEAFAKHTLMGFFLLANISKKIYIHQFQAGSDETHKQFEFIERGYFLHNVWKEVRELSSYGRTFQAIYEQDFKDDGLLGYALSHNQGIMFNVLFHGLTANEGKLQFNQKDLSYLKANQTHKNTVLFDSQFDSLFLPEVYVKLPKEVREYLVSEYDKTVFEKLYQGRVMQLEKQIQQNNVNASILTDIEKEKQEELLNQAQKNINQEKIVNHEKITQEKTLTEAISHLAQMDNHFSLQVQEKLNVILAKSLKVSEKVELLDPSTSIEFKNIISTILPKYLTVFSHTQEQSEESKEMNFLATLGLVDKYIDSCLHNIEFNTNNDFDVVDSFLRNKLSSFDTQANEITQHSNLEVSVSEKIKQNRINDNKEVGNVLKMKSSSH